MTRCHRSNTTPTMEEDVQEPPYSFKQSLQDVTVTIPLPPNTRAKLLNVRLMSH